MCRKRFFILLPVLMLFANSVNCTGNPTSRALDRAFSGFVHDTIKYVIVPACVITGGIFAVGCLAGYLAGRCKGKSKVEKNDDEMQKNVIL